MKVPKIIIVLALAIFLSSISSSMIFAATPLFLLKTLGLSVMVIAIMEGLTEGLSQICKMLSGIICDRINNKKPLLLLSFFLMIVSQCLFIFGNDAITIFVSKVIERIASGLLVTVRDSIVIHNSPKELKSTYLGYFSSLKNLALVLGSGIMTIAAIYIPGDRKILILALILTIVAFVIIYFFVNQLLLIETKREKSNYSFKLSKNYWTIVGVACIFMFARFTDTMIILKLNSLGAPQTLSTSIMAIINIASIISCLYIGKKADKYSRYNLLYFSFITLFLSHLCFCFSNSLLINLVGILLWGAQRNTSQLLFSAIISDHVPTESLGRALGLYYLFIGVVSFVSSFIAGYLGVTYCFIFGAIVSFIALLSLFYITRK